MTTTAALTDTQFRTAATVLSLAALADNGEVTEYAARTSGGYIHLAALTALVTKGVLVVRYEDFTMPSGPLAGQVLTGQRVFSAAA